MTLPPVAAESATVVVTGQWRPVTVSPKWLRDHDLIGDAELNRSSFELLIPNEAATFEAGWLRCQANAQVIQFETQQPAEFERLRDLAAGFLREQSGTMITHMGINRNAHFRIADQNEWHAIGDRLVHNEIWEGILHLPGMRSVTYWGIRTDGYGGRIHVQVEPSLPFPPGVFVAYNDHYDLSKDKKVPSSRDEFGMEGSEDSSSTEEKIAVAIEVLNVNWSDSMQRFNVILEALFARVGASDASQ
jgi:hypothetical protein